MNSIDAWINRRVPAGEALAQATAPRARPLPRPLDSGEPSRPGCPVCGGPLSELRAKLQCDRCHSIIETCCEGGRG